MTLKAWRDVPENLPTYCPNVPEKRHHLEDLGMLQAGKLAPLVGALTATAQVPVVRVAFNG